MNEPNSNSHPMEIDCISVKRKIEAGDDFEFLDCREQNEYEFVRIEGARLVPMSTIQETVIELEQIKQKEVIIHCHHGGRSLQVARWLRQMGFENAKSMAGGIDQWALEIDTTLERY